MRADSGRERRRAVARGGAGPTRYP